MTTFYFSERRFWENQFEESNVDDDAFADDQELQSHAAPASPTLRNLQYASSIKSKMSPMMPQTPERQTWAPPSHAALAASPYRQQQSSSFMPGSMFQHGSMSPSSVNSQGSGISTSDIALAGSLARSSTGSNRRLAGSLESLSGDDWTTRYCKKVLIQCYLTSSLLFRI